MLEETLKQRKDVTSESGKKKFATYARECLQLTVVVEDVQLLGCHVDVRSPYPAPLYVTASLRDHAEHHSVLLRVHILT